MEENTVETYRYQGQEGERVPLNAEKVIVERRVRVLPDSFCAAPDPNQRSQVREVVLHERARVIGKNAFRCCDRLREISIYSTTEIIGYSAFGLCAGLQKVEFIAPMPHPSHPRGLQVIGEYAFVGCQFQRIKIPSTVKTIGEGVFGGCTKLIEVNLFGLADLQVIPYRAFSGCESLQTVCLSSSIECIGSWAFSRCTKLVTVKISPPDVKTRIVIHHEAFVDCWSLMNIALPDGHAVTATAFKNCTLLHQRLGDLEASNQEETSFDFSTHKRICLGLSTRFHGHSIHKMCYHSSTTAVEDLIQVLMDQGEGQLLTVDAFDMTAFHLLCSSVEPRKDLLQALLVSKNFPPHVLGYKDANGKRAMDYLVANWTLETASMLEMLLQCWIIRRMHQWGNASRVAIMIRRINTVLKETIQDRRDELWDETCTTFELYERLESISILELALWKKQHGSSGWNEDRTKRIGLDRHQSLNQCGASVVLPNVSAFLGQLEYLNR
mmetsp:Transcript_44388/g.106945  ORF Transcript_44388/g.106945 Transcript_44388/m.106945 type:complete len:496 (-) Transcript_44388:551-2038(-)